MDEHKRFGRFQKSYALRSARAERTFAWDVVTTSPFRRRAAACASRGWLLGIQMIPSWKLDEYFEKIKISTYKAINYFEIGGREGRVKSVLNKSIYICALKNQTHSDWYLRYFIYLDNTPRLTSFGGKSFKNRKTSKFDAFPGDLEVWAVEKIVKIVKDCKRL